MQVSAHTQSIAYYIGEKSKLFCVSLYHSSDEIYVQWRKFSFNDIVRTNHLVHEDAHYTAPYISRTVPKTY